MANKDKIVEIEKRTDVYRETTIGKTLFLSLKELVESGKITTSLANATLEEFDRCISSVLKDLPCTHEAVFQAGKIDNYRLVGEQWTVKLQNVLFSYADQNVDDDIRAVNECVIRAAKPLTFSINMDRIKKLKELSQQLDTT